MSKARRRIDWQEVHARLRASQSGTDQSPEHLAGIYRRRALDLATPRAQADATSTAMSVLVFTLKGERFGIDLIDLVGVLPPQRYTPVPGSAPELLGVINHRGRICSVLDLSRLMGLTDAAGSESLRQKADGRSYVLLLRRPGREVGLQVGGIESIRQIAPEDLVALGDLALRDATQPRLEARFAEQRSKDGLTLVIAETIRTHPILQAESSP